MATSSSSSHPPYLTPLNSSGYEGLRVNLEKTRRLGVLGSTKKGRDGLLSPVDYLELGSADKANVLDYSFTLSGDRQSLRF